MRPFSDCARDAVTTTGTASAHIQRPSAFRSAGSMCAHYWGMRMSETLSERMARVAADMRETSRLLDALGTELDRKPGGYQKAYHCIHRARELDGASRMLEEWAREVDK